MIRKRGKTYEVRAYDPRVKKNVHVGTRATKAEARALEREKTEEFQRRRTVPQTIAEFAPLWEQLYPRPRDTTNQHNRERISLFVEEFGDRAFDDIGRLEARAWVTRNPGRYFAVRAFVNDAIDAEVATTNAFSKLGVDRAPRRQLKPDWLTQEEVHAIADTARELWPPTYAEHFRALVLFAAYTCVRPGELFGLDHRDVEEGGYVHIRRQVRADGTFGPPKTGEPRTVVVPPVARVAIEECPPLSQSALFATRRGHRFRRGSHYYYWRQLAAAAGRPSMDFYELRHFGATLLLEMGLSDFDVSVQMGHKNTDLVREVYGHPSHARARQRIAQAFEEAA